MCFKKILFVLFISLLFSSCSLRNLTGDGAITEKKSFMAQRIKKGIYGPDELVNAVLVSETRHLAIYVENGYKASDYTLGRIQQDFEAYYDDMIETYGEHTDLDANSKIILLLMKLNIDSASTSVLGYFRPVDLIYGKGNNGEILYMDVDRSNLDPNKMVGTILHEFQHLINYNLNKDNIDVWLNEALSESTAILYNDTTIVDRIEEFNKLKGYYSFYTWNLPDDWHGGNTANKNIFSSYPSASIFMFWLYVKSGSNKKIFEDLVKIRYLPSYQRILSVATKNGILATSWDNLLLTWIKDVDDGLLSKNGKRPYINPYDHMTAKLYPGAIIVANGSKSKITGQNSMTAVLEYQGTMMPGESKKENSKVQRTAVVNKDTTVSTTPNSVTVGVTGGRSLSR